MSRKLTIYLVDLTHKSITLSIDTFPLGIAYLASYASKHCKTRHDFRLFRFYEDFEKALEEQTPDIVATSNYVWNHNYSLFVLEQARNANPEVLTLMGGPNLPTSLEDQVSFFNGLKQCDAYIVGEGERVFAKVLDDYEESNFDRSSFLNHSQAYVLKRNDEGKVIASHEKWAERMKDLDEIPSPYQSGLLDEFFSKGLYPIIETNRGCPFTCTFCHEGGSYYSKIARFSTERVKADIDYISRRCKSDDTLFIADSNFGMYKQDLEISQHIGEIQEQTGWPRFINCTTGKNRPDMVIEAVDLLNGAMVVTNSVQSMEPEVLKNIRRSNIKLDVYNQIQQAIRDRSLKSMADMILCLPGESIESHFKGVAKLLDNGIQRILPYQLMLLNGTELNTRETRERHGFETRYRIVPRNFTVHDSRAVFEYEEIVISTNTLSFEDYLNCRKLHLILEICFKEEPFYELFALAESIGISRSRLIFRIYELWPFQSEKLATLMGDFQKETRDELHKTPEALNDFIQARHEEVMNGIVGANLMQKYSTKAWFENLNAVVDGVSQAAKSCYLQNEALHESCPDFCSQIDEVSSYLKNCYVNVYDVKSIEGQQEFQSLYDVHKWIEAGHKPNLEEFRFSEPQVLSLTLSESRRSYLKAKLETFGTKTGSVGKMLTRMWLQELRRDIQSMQ